MTNTLVAERRRHKRIALCSEVECSYVGAMGRWPTRLMDISVSGMFIDCLLPPPMGTVIDLTFNLHGYDKPIVAKAVVVFRQDTVGMGVQFTEIDPEVQDYIESLIARIEKAG